MGARTARMDRGPPMTKYHLLFLMFSWLNGVLVGRWLARRAK